MTKKTEVVQEWLGWCPHAPTAQAVPFGIDARILLVAVIGLLLLATAVLMVPAHATGNVAIWAFRVDDSGVKHFVGRLPATEDTSGNLLFSPAGATTSSLQPGKYSLIIEHPGTDGSFRLMLDGETVKLRLPDSAANPIMLFKIGGPGSLQQEDAYLALIAAFDGDNPYGTSPASGTPITSGYVTEREYRVDT